MSQYPRSYADGDGYAPRSYHHHSAPAHVAMDFAESEKDLRIRALQQDLQSTQQLLQRERERGENPELLMEVTRLRDEVTRETIRNGELKRELEHVKEKESLQSNLKIVELQQEVTQLQQEAQSREQEIRSKDTSLRMLQDQHAAELERARGRQDQHERMLSEVRRERDDVSNRLRSSNEELESKLKQALQELEAAQRQLERKEDYGHLLEEEARLQRGRLEQSERLVVTQQTQLHEQESMLQSLQLELDSKTRAVADLEDRATGAEATSEEFQQKADKLRRDYNDIGDLVSATELQKSACLVSRKVRDILAEHNRAQMDHAEWEKRQELWQYEDSNKEMRVDQLERELSKLQELLRRREMELTSVQEELTQRTHRLRVLTTAREADQRELQAREERLVQEQRLREERLQRDQYTKDDRVARLEEALREKERQMLETARQERQANDLVNDERSRLEARHSRQISDLQTEVSQLREEARDGRQFGQACQTLGRLLNLDPDTTTTVYLEKLIREVEVLFRETEELRLGRVPLDGQLGMSGAFGGTHPHHHHSMGGGYGGGGLGGLGPSATSPGRLHGQRHDGTGLMTHSSRFGEDGGPGHGAGDVTWLKQELREAEERWVKLRVQHDGFRRSVAKVLQVSEEDSDEEFMRALKRAFRGDRGGSSGGPRTVVGRPSTGSSKQLQRKLNTALKTIESQDLWIELLSKKVDQNPKRSGSARGGSRSQAHEVQRLQRQVEALKQQLFAEHHGRSPQASMNMSGLTGGLGDMTLGASAGLSEKLQDMSARLEKHIQFRTEVMNIIGIRSITCPDSEILHQLRFLKTEVDRLQRAENMSRMVPSVSPPPSSWGRSPRV